MFYDVEYPKNGTNSKIFDYFQFQIIDQIQ